MNSPVYCITTHYTLRLTQVRRCHLLISEAEAIILLVLLACQLVHCFRRALKRSMSSTFDLRIIGIDLNEATKHTISLKIPLNTS
jgi:hypothetical protein